MVKVHIDGEEWWPVFVIREGNNDDSFLNDVGTEVDEQTLLRWRQVFEDFQNVQNEIQKAYGY